MSNNNHRCFKCANAENQRSGVSISVSNVEKIFHINSPYSLNMNKDKGFLFMFVLVISLGVNIASYDRQNICREILYIHVYFKYMGNKFEKYYYHVIWNTIGVYSCDVLCFQVTHMLFFFKQKRKIIHSCLWWNKSLLIGYIVIWYV